MTGVKICGLRSEGDVVAARGADYLGFVVATGTRRSLDVCEARRLMGAADRPTVAVTTSPDPGFVAEVARALRPSAVQLSGPVDGASFSTLRNSLPCELWVAVHIGGAEPALDRGVLDAADCVVLDTASPQGGGSGVAHDHALSARVARTIRGRVSLAGGLTPENVQAAIEAVRPDVVDVSSGVETNGVKDAAKIERFIERVRSCQ